jgi:hypothetical protein
MLFTWELNSRVNVIIVERLAIRPQNAGVEFKVRIIMVIIIIKQMVIATIRLTMGTPAVIEPGPGIIIITVIIIIIITTVQIILRIDRTCIVHIVIRKDMTLQNVVRRKEPKTAVR